MSKALNKARLDLEFAANLAEDDLNDLNNRQKELEDLQSILKRQQGRMSVQAVAMENRSRVEKQLQPPSYWDWKTESEKLGNAWDIKPLPRTGKLFEVFQKLMKETDPGELNKGRDVVEKGSYSELDLVGLWRLENPAVWKRFAAE